MKKNTNLEIGERVRQVRVSRGFSREALAELLDISTLFLSYIECGQRGMSLQTLQNICQVLNVSSDYLLFGKENNETSVSCVTNAVLELEEKYLPIALESINNLKRIITLVNNQE